jgi:hypothetical protein
VQRIHIVRRHKKQRGAIENLIREELQIEEHKSEKLVKNGSKLFKVNV